MIAFLNLAVSETLVIAVIAILVFGRRLPEVAGRAYYQLRRLRQSLDHLRRETGIDREMRNIDRTVREAAREANLQTLPPPPAPRVARDEPLEPDVEEDRATPAEEPQPDAAEGAEGARDPGSQAS